MSDLEAEAVSSLPDFQVHILQIISHVSGTLSVVGVCSEANLISTFLSSHASCSVFSSYSLLFYLEI